MLEMHSDLSRIILGPGEIPPDARPDEERPMLLPIDLPKDLGKTLGAPAPLPASFQTNTVTRRQGCRRSQFRLMRSSDSFLAAHRNLEPAH